MSREYELIGYGQNDFSDDIYLLRLAQKCARQDKRGKYARKKHQGRQDKG